MVQKIDVSLLAAAIAETPDLVKSVQDAEQGLSDKVNQLNAEIGQLKDQVAQAPEGTDNTDVQAQIDALVSQVNDHNSTLKMVSAISNGTVAAPPAAQS